MKIVTTETNEYGKNFVSFSMDGRESFSGRVYKDGFGYSFFTETVDKKTVCIQVIRQKEGGKAFTGKGACYTEKYAVGYGNGPAMGWEIGLTKRKAVAIARATMLACQQVSKLASITLEN